jgi:putative ABC transport system permease protein
LRGRFFTEHDVKGTSRVAIINNTLAKKFFPDEDPIGKRIQLSNEPKVNPEIVGIVGDVKRVSLTREIPAQTYEPYLQQPFPFMTLVLRTAGDPTLLSETIRREVLNLDREQPIHDLNTLDRLVANSTAEQRSLTLLLWSFAAAALTMAAVGFYGVMSYAVMHRTREIGIRMALGAQTGDVVKLIVRQGLTLTLMGLAIGLVTALGVTRLLSGMLFRVDTTDPLTFTAVALLLHSLHCWPVGYRHSELLKWIRRLHSATNKWAIGFKVFSRVGKMAIMNKRARRRRALKQSWQGIQENQAIQLLGAQCDHRINARGTRSGDPGCQERRGAE